MAATTLPALPHYEATPSAALKTYCCLMLMAGAGAIALRAAGVFKA
jgi:hypothetical protein